MEKTINDHIETLLNDLDLIVTIAQETVHHYGTPGMLLSNKETYYKLEEVLKRYSRQVVMDAWEAAMDYMDTPKSPNITEYIEKQGL